MNEAVIKPETVFSPSNLSKDRLLEITTETEGFKRKDSNLVLAVPRFAVSFCIDNRNPGLALGATQNGAFVMLEAGSIIYPPNDSPYYKSQLARIQERIDVTESRGGHMDAFYLEGHNDCGAIKAIDKIIKNYVDLGNESLKHLDEAQKGWLSAIDSEINDFAKMYKKFDLNDLAEENVRLRLMERTMLLKSAQNLHEIFNSGKIHFKGKAPRIIPGFSYSHPITPGQKTVEMSDMKGMERFLHEAKDFVPLQDILKAAQEKGISVSYGTFFKHGAKTKQVAVIHEDSLLSYHLKQAENFAEIDKKQRELS